MSQTDSYRPNYRDRSPPRPPYDAQEAMYHFRGNANDRSEPTRGRFERRLARNSNFRNRLKISERPLLQRKDDSREERVLGTIGQEKFRDVENMTDSDEAAMEDSEDEDLSRVKRLRIGDADISTNDTPKWSNPDPYTSLPAPNETTGKKVDVVKLIRKARNDMQKRDTAEGANVEDFISFGADAEGGANRAIPTEPAAFRNYLPRKPHSFEDPSPSDHNISDNSDRMSLSTSYQMADENSRTLGKRKRGDESGTRSTIKLVTKRGAGAYYSNAMVLDKWRAIDSASPAPWLSPVTDVSPAVVFHKEVLDFYEWVRPQDYEFSVRSDCIKRLLAEFNRFQPGDLRAFGSYGAGLFLPTGDMDLVFLQRNFLARLNRGESGISAPLSNNQFRNWLSFIRNSSIAKPGSIVPIPRAKVPIIKFVDRITGLKIDLSFNNDTGLVANETFLKWKKQHPAMPIVVSIIKQYLMIRGLNDVSTGGLGGFSTICLVTSLIQHLPNNGGPQNLGQILLEFFNLYGNHLDRNKVAIRLDPPGYIDKKTYAPQLFSNDKKGRLTIIDPHRPENNISGGTSEIKIIADSFADAYTMLHDMLNSFQVSTSNISFLEGLIGGNFEAYTLSRNALYSLYVGQPGQIAPIIVPRPPPPPPPPSVLPGVAPPPPPAPAGDDNESDYEDDDEDDDDSQSDSVDRTSVSRPKQARLSPSEKRATRLKTLRPELAPQVGKTISVADAIALGGYKNGPDMKNDLAKREGANSSAGLKPAEKRAQRFKALRPDLASKIGPTLTAPKAMQLGGYKTKKEMGADLKKREEENRAV